MNSYWYNICLLLPKHPLVYLLIDSQLSMHYMGCSVVLSALTLASTEVRFHIDSETHDPIDVQTKELRYINK